MNKIENIQNYINVNNIKETSKIIRYVYSTIDKNELHKVSKVEQILKQLNVKTKNGDNIRYQHVRNVLTQNLNIKL